MPTGQLVKRHAGVLGLAALIGACPYTVPEWLPDVLDHITNHLRDPAPIQVEQQQRVLHILRPEYMFIIPQTAVDKNLFYLSALLNMVYRVFQVLAKVQIGK